MLQVRKKERLHEGVRHVPNLFQRISKRRAYPGYKKSIMVDVIAELINNLKVSNKAGKATLALPYSKFREAVLESLQKEGYIKSFAKKGKKVIKTIEVELAYEDGVAKIQGVQQISKYSRRMYTKASEVRPVRSGYGSLILTTPKGIMADKEARKAKIGGEVLFKIW